MDVPAPIRDALAKLALDTQVRQAAEQLSAAHKGGLIVLGYDETVEALCEQGFYGDGVEASAPNISQFAKMDLAIVLSDDMSRIRRLSTNLAPRSRIQVQGSGARHLNAARLARDIPHPVVAVSEESGRITVYVGEHAHVLSPPPVLISRAAIALLSLDSCEKTLSSARSDAFLVEEVTERARQAVVEIDLYLLELGDRGEHVEQLLDGYCARLGLDRSPAHTPGAAQRVPLITAVLRDLDDWYEHALRAADHVLGERTKHVLAEHDLAFPRMFFDSDRDAIRWYDEKAEKLLASIRRVAEAGDDETALRRSLAMLEYFYRRKPWRQWIEVLALALLAARQLGDATAEASLLTSLGVAQRELRHYDVAFQLWDEAGKVWRDLGDRLGQAELLNHLAYAYDERGDAERALHCAAEALTLIGPGEDERLRGKVLNNSSGIRCRQGEFGAALSLVDQAVDAFESVGYRRGVAWATSNKGNVYRDSGRHQEAMECYQTALAERLASEEHYGAAVTRAELGRTLLAIGDVAAAREHLLLAEAYFLEIGEPRVPTIRAARNGSTPDA